MNQAQRNEQLVAEDLKKFSEARAAREAVLAKVATWMPEGGHEQWGEECFFRLWLVYRESRNTFGFKKILDKVLHPRFGVRPYRSPSPALFGLLSWWEPSIELGLPARRWALSRTDDELEELIEDWESAVDRVRYPEEIYGKQQPLSEWILERMESGAIDWHRRDREYWRPLFREVSDWREVCFPAGIPPLTVRGKVKTWPFFLRVLAEKIGASDGHIPRSWVGSGGEPGSAVQWLRRVRFLHRVVRDQPGAARGDDPVADYGLLVGRALNKHLQQMERKLRDLDESCLDNFRFAELGRSGDVRRYRVRRAHGCCGFYDIVVRIYGKKYVIGCNYGH